MSSKLIRVGGLAAVLGGALLVLGDLVPIVAGVSSDAYTGTMPEKIASVLFLTGLVFILVALVGLYLHQAEAAGRFGLVAFLVTLVGTGLMVGSDWSEVFVAPVLLEEAPTLLSEEGPVLIMVGFILNFAVYSLGWLLFGIATFRARVFPRAAAILLMVGVLLPLTGLPWVFIVWNSAVIWLGLSILREKGRASSSTAGVEARPQLY